MTITRSLLTWTLCLLALVIASTAAAQDGPTITFLAGDAARAAIVDESVEPYISLLCAHEMQVKAGVELEGDTLDAQRDFVKQHYADNTRDFTDAEQAVITAIIAKIQPLFERHYPRLAGYGWSFIKVTQAVEQGLPHTHGASIILPESFLRQVVPVYRQMPEAVVPSLVNLLIHEQMHVVQRFEPDTFAPFYTEQWGLEHVESIAGHDWLDERQLINPDGVDVNWIMNVGSEASPRYIQPNVILKRFDNRPSRMPRDFRMVAIEVDCDDDGQWHPVIGDDGLPAVTDLGDESVYMAHYGASHNVYGPNESLADLFARVMLADHFEPADGSSRRPRPASARALDPVRDFMREAFGEPVSE